MTHANTPPSTTLLLIDETTSGKTEGFGQRVRRWFGGGLREGLTAKEKERKVKDADMLVKSLNKQTADKQKDMFAPTQTQEVLNAFASYLDTLVLGLTVDQGLFMPSQMKSGDTKDMYASVNNIKNLSEFASLVKQQAKMAPVISTSEL